MRRIIMFALLTLTMLGGVAFADRDHRGGVRVDRQHRGVERPAYRYNNTPRYTYSRPTYQYSRPSYQYSRPSYSYARRPIYVQRPVIRYRYYNYYQRPALIVENYPAMDGYTWVAGHWDWNGSEWLWNPGHYEPNTPDAPHAYGEGDITHNSDYNSDYYYNQQY